MRPVADAERLWLFMRALGAEREADPFLRLLPRLKEDLDLNVELASPAQFLFRFPNINPGRFRAAVERVARVEGGEAPPRA